MAEIKLNAEKREAQGKNQVDKLRNAGKIPAVVYQKDQEPISIQVNELEFNRVYGEAGTSILVDLEVAGDKTHTVLIKEAQKHPVRDQYLHVDFHEVNMNEKIKVVVPIILLNRGEIRVQPSVLNQQLEEVEVECLPSNIPSQTEMDVKEMQIGDTLTVADLDIAKDENIDILLDLETPVASLSEPQEQPAEEEETVDAADVPEIGQEDKEKEKED